jgi:hypothetical protein
MEKRAINYSFVGEKLATKFNLSAVSARKYALVVASGKNETYIPAGFKEAMIQEIEKQTNQEISKLQKL